VKKKVSLAKVPCDHARQVISPECPVTVEAPLSLPGGSVPCATPDCIQGCPGVDCTLVTSFGSYRLSRMHDLEQDLWYWTTESA
jgi:hypothetical protein